MTITIERCRFCTILYDVASTTHLLAAKIRLRYEQRNLKIYLMRENWRIHTDTIEKGNSMQFVTLKEKSRLDSQTSKKINLLGSCPKQCVYQSLFSTVILVWPPAPPQCRTRSKACEGAGLSRGASCRWGGLATASWNWGIPTTTMRCNAV